MSDVPRCSEPVAEPPGYWHTHACDRRAAYLVRKKLAERVVCGIHRNALMRDGWKQVKP
jgi:hypothetical protein